MFNMLNTISIKNRHFLLVDITTSYGQCQVIN